VKRVVVFGTTGSGKSWLARRLSARAGLRVIELDELYWGPDWQGAPDALFRHRVERETRDGGWIVVGNYAQVRDLTWRPADTLVWFDLPFALVFWRLLRRTLGRVISGEELWRTGNRETFVNAFLSRQSILLWAMRTHRRNRVRFETECAFLGKDKNVVRLRTPKEVENFLLSS
jgi:adenylate kinase family enzyme